jgi:hypothetical protein
MDWEMVLRPRLLPAAVLLCLLALAAAVAAPIASADRPHSGGGYVDDGTYDTDGGGYYDDGTSDYDNGGSVPVTSGDDDGDYGDDGDDDPFAPTPTPKVPTTPTAPVLPTIPVTKTVPGTVAKLRTDGKAAIPRGAPKRVQALIAAANQIVGKPYKWGGGHAKLVDKGYDCSGAVSFALIGAGMLASPMVSGTLAKWQATGGGKWLSIYANKGHVYLEVAGLRLDTSAVGDPTRLDGVRWRPLIGRRAGFHARHVVGL